MNCFTWVFIIVGGIFLVLSLIRWFEQITEAVQLRWWNKTFLLIFCPPAVWFYSSRVSAGRPVPAPRHEPVRGFGSMPKLKGSEEQPPPPGTPPEFLVKPQVSPAKKVPAKSKIDPAQIAKLKQKMRDQGMLGDDQA
jgi:hypothetical protein